MRLVDRVAYINHDIDDAIRFGILAAEELPQRRGRAARGHGLEADRHARPRPVEHSEQAGDIVQGEEVGEAMLSLRSFMFDAVYLGPQTRAQHEQARDVVQQIFEHLAARGDEPEAIVEYVSGMTDRFALDYARRL